MLPIQNASALRDILLQSRTPATAAAMPKATEQEGVFGGMLHAAQQQIKAADTRAQQTVTGLLNGQGVEVHEAMIATQQADLTFELALQVRNKAVSAYQQMMQMQF
jgi:flagellar hook-basal body complex protein FliE